MSQSIGDAIAEIRANQRKLLMALSSGGPSGPITEVNSAAILTLLTTGIDFKLDVLLDGLVGTRTFYYDVTTTTGSSLTGLKSITIANTGSANGSLAGKVLKPGISLSFNAEGGEFPTGLFTWDATGTEFLITAIYK